MSKSKLSANEQPILITKGNFLDKIYCEQISTRMQSIIQSKNKLYLIIFWAIFRRQSRERVSKLWFFERGLLSKWASNENQPHRPTMELTANDICSELWKQCELCFHSLSIILKAQQVHRTLFAKDSFQTNSAWVTSIRIRCSCVYFCQRLLTSNVCMSKICAKSLLPKLIWILKQETLMT